MRKNNSRGVIALGTTLALSLAACEAPRVPAADARMDATMDATTDAGLVDRPDHDAARDVLDDRSAVGTDVLDDRGAVGTDVGRDGPSDVDVVLPPRPTEARPFGPLPSASVASARPRFELRGTLRVDTVVEVCADRACQMVLQRLAVVAPAVVASAPLPRGTVYWRVIPGGAAAPSPVWALRVLAQGTLDVDARARVGGDLDGDGYDDVIYPLRAGLPGGGRVFGVFLGSPAGVSARATAGLDAAAGDALLSDIDGDGRSEVFVGDRGWRSERALQGGAADLTLSAAVVDAHADVDGDGREDLILADGSLRYGAPSGPTGALTVLGCPGAAWRAQRFVGDHDGDGYADVLVSDPARGAMVATGGADRVLYVEGCPRPPAVRGFGEPCVWTWSSTITSGLGSCGGRADAFLGWSSGSDDKCIRWGPRWEVAHRAGAGTDAFGLRGEPLSVGDLNGDGRADVMIPSHGDYASCGSAGTTVVADAFVATAGVGDTNGDGYDDLLTRAADASLRVVSGRPDLTRAGATWSLDLDATPGSRDAGVAGDAGDAGDAGATREVVPVFPSTGTRVTGARPTFRWALSGGASGAEVEVCSDPTCATQEARFTADGTAGTTGVSLRAGRHFWRVRARRGVTPSGDFSRPRAFRVALDPRGRDIGFGWRDLDTNGDGVSDVVLGTRLYLGAPGAALTPALTADAPLVPLGDVDGDGRTDLRAGATLYLGSAGGAARAGTTAGDLQRVGDLDNDGYDDVVSRAPGEGVWFAYRGGPAGPDVVGRVALVLDDPRSNCFDGCDRQSATVVPVGDVNDDGYADLGLVVVVGRSLVPTAFIFSGGPTLQDLPTRRRTLGRAVLMGIGDINGDARPDLLVSYDVYPGYLHDYHPAIHFGDSELRAAVPFSAVNGGTSPGEFVGLGDTDGDGFGEGCLSGLCHGDPSCGGVFLSYVHAFVRGGAAGWPGPFTLRENPLIPLGDVNGDGYADAGEVVAGTLRVFLGSPGGLAATPERVLP